MPGLGRSGKEKIKSETGRPVQSSHRLAGLGVSCGSAVPPRSCRDRSEVREDGSRLRRRSASRESGEEALLGLSLASIAP
jgi:hypothetical protein